MEKRVLVPERPDADAPFMDRDATTDAPENSSLNFEIRPTCFICGRLSVTFDTKDRPLCARHATIFMVDHAALRTRRGNDPT